MKKVTLTNIITNIILQITTIFSGFIIPRLILQYFGSEINGLVSSITQFLNFITFIEGGVTGVIMANLYKPLLQHDYEKISSIVVTTEKFFKKIALIFVIYAIGLSIIYPLFSKIEYSFTFISELVLIISIGLFFQYAFSFTWKTILNADKKGYIIYITQTIIVIINLVLSILSLQLFKNIHILKFIESMLFLIQPIVYNKAIKKYYLIDKKATEDKELIKGRWNGFGINIAAFIHGNTDIALLTLFTNLSTVSIYSVYYLVIAGIKKIILSISGAMEATIGHLYNNGDIQKFNKKFDIYELVMFFIVFTIFSVATLLITPFVEIYTFGINDANYSQPIFGYIFILAEAIYMIRQPHITLAYSANEFKKITKPAFAEAFFNIVLSILLIFKFGLIGIAIGTSIGMAIRAIWHIAFTKELINRPQWKFYKKVLLFSIAFLIGLFIVIKVIPLKTINIANWIKYGIIYTAVFGGLYMLICILFYKGEVKEFKKYLAK